MVVVGLSARRLSAERILLVLLLVTTAILLVWTREPWPSGRIASTAARQRAPLPDASTKFAIISMTTAETTYDFPAFSTKTSYARKHGYDMIWDFEPAPYPKVWDKLSLVQAAIDASIAGDKAYEWIFMVDFDTLVTNSSITLESIVEKSLRFAENAGKQRGDIDLILTRDCHSINAGVLFFRASPYILSFIQEWAKGRYIKNDVGEMKYNEQEILWQMLRQDTLGMAAHSIIVPQTWFDAYPEEIYKCRDARDPASWNSSMFMIHLAGANYHLRDELENPVNDLMWKYFKLIANSNGPVVTELLVLEKFTGIPEV